MRIYHPKHGILNISDQIEIKRLLETGGEVFNINDKPWQRKAKQEEIKIEEAKVIEEKQEEVKQELTIHVPKRGRPFKHGDN